MEVFDKEFVLQDHRRKVHLKQERPGVPCYICGRVLRGSLEKHVELVSHILLGAVLVCKFSEKDSSLCVSGLIKFCYFNLSLKHACFLLFKVHGNDNVKCDLCGTNFKSKASLDRHKEISVVSPNFN